MVLDEYIDDDGDFPHHIVVAVVVGFLLKVGVGKIRKAS